MANDTVVYASGKTPSGYFCSKCEATGIKLWRVSNTSYVELQCAHCACETEKCPQVISVINSEGQYIDPQLGPTYQIGIFVPAIPTEDDYRAYWRYPNIPAEGVKWWHQLPTLKTA